ncbi:hypothetical protein GCM10009677_32980 [Sphaerisporangium rubeum]|uniref:Uncharacterized protein n=1 Tax=Sphaerisporangium rubeum TaxID=321317 RepID=A0A7X0IGN7_9ACTN|nr:hypothetical protein [Sphaerisporangium rubeum]
MAVNLWVAAGVSEPPGPATAQAKSDITDLVHSAELVEAAVGGLNRFERSTTTQHCTRYVAIPLT